MTAELADKVAGQVADEVEKRMEQKLPAMLINAARSLDSAVTTISEEPSSENAPVDVPEDRVTLDSRTQNQNLARPVVQAELASQKSATNGLQSLIEVFTDPQAVQALAQKAPEQFEQLQKALTNVSKATRAKPQAVAV